MSDDGEVQLPWDAVSRRNQELAQAAQNAQATQKAAPRAPAHVDVRVGDDATPQFQAGIVPMAPQEPGAAPAEPRPAPAVVPEPLVAEGVTGADTAQLAAVLAQVNEALKQLSEAQEQMRQQQTATLAAPEQAGVSDWNAKPLSEIIATQTALAERVRALAAPMGLDDEILESVLDEIGSGSNVPRRGGLSGALVDALLRRLPVAPSLGMADRRGVVVLVGGTGVGKTTAAIQIGRAHV